MSASKLINFLGGKLGVRLFSVVILCIVAIETVVLLPTYLDYRRDLEIRLEHVGRTIVVMALKPRHFSSDSDLLVNARMAVRYSELSGGALYRPDGSFIGQFGETPDLKPGDAGDQPFLMRMTSDNKRLEVVWTAEELDLPVTVVGRMDAEWIAPKLNAFIWRIVELDLLITVFVGIAIMLVFNRTVLRRILHLRQRMAAASENPEAAAAETVTLQSRDELDDLTLEFHRMMKRINQEIADNRSDKEALMESERQYQELYDNAADMYASVEADSKIIIRCNQTLATNLGMTKEEIIGRHILDLYHPDCRDQARDGFPIIDQTGRIHRDDLQLGRPDGSKVHVDLHVTSVRNEAGDVLFRNVVWRYIGKRIQAEANLRDSEAALAKAQEIAKIGNWRWSTPNGDLISCSAEYARIYGIPIDEDPVRMTAQIMKAKHPDDLDYYTETIQKADDQGLDYSFEYRIVRPDGEVRHVIEVGEAVFNESGVPIEHVGTLQDITERKFAENEVVASQARLAGILDIAPEAVLTIGNDMTINMFNQAAERIFGYEAGEVLGRPFDSLMPERFRKGHGSLVEAFAQSSDSARYMDQRGDIFGRRKDGSEFPAAASVSKLIIGEEQVYTVMVRDITAQRQIQDELLAAKNEAEVANLTKSEFLAAMSHELRTPLNAILGFSDIMRNEYLGPLGSKQYVEYVEDIHQSGDHLLSLLSNLLDISAIEAGKMLIKKEDLAVEEIVMDCLRLVTVQAREKGVEMVHAIAEPMPVLHADRRSVKQILLNLLTNSIKFTPQGGSVSLTTVASDSHITFTVTDNGVGITADKLPHVTDPFTRVEKDPLHSNEGWGLGLAITSSLIDRHKGDMNIESEIGVGTKVTVTLPLL